MKKSIFIPVFLFMVAALFSGCQVIGDIFKTGVGVGIFITVIVIIIIIAIISKAGKNS